MDIHVEADTLLNLSDELGSGRWRIQNRGPGALYRIQSMNPPDADTVVGFRHATDAVFELSVDTNLNPHWCWSPEDCVIVAESAPW